MSRLYVSFWNVCLENLPEGTFRRRAISFEEAKRSITLARERGSLLCVSEDDLLSPRHKKELKDHKDLIDVLIEHFGITLSLEDFLSDGSGDGYCINPLNCVGISGDNKLLVVTCSYVCSHENQQNKRLKFLIEPASVGFHLIEAV